MNIGVLLARLEWGMTPSRVRPVAGEQLDLDPAGVEGTLRGAVQGLPFLGKLRFRRELSTTNLYRVEVTFQRGTAPDDEVSRLAGTLADELKAVFGEPATTQPANTSGPIAQRQPEVTIWDVAGSILTLEVATPRNSYAPDLPPIQIGFGDESRDGIAQTIAQYSVGRPRREAMDDAWVGQRLAKAKLDREQIRQRLIAMQGSEPGGT